MKNDLITIIIPIYNAEKYLKMCLDSVVKQTYKNLEIILINDGSTDGSDKICDNYAKKDRRVNVIHKKNSGQSDCKNIGTSIAKGKYITYVDSDDFIDDKYIEYLYYLIKKDNCDMSITGYEVIHNDGKKEKTCNHEKILTPEETLEKYLYFNGINSASWAKLYKTSIAKKVKYPIVKCFEDDATVYKLISLCNKISIGNTQMYHYIIRKNSVTTSRFDENKLYLLTAVDEMQNYLLPLYPNLKKAIIRRKINARFSTLCRLINSNEKNQKIEKDLIDYINNNKKYILSDKNTPKRDKIAIFILSINKHLFKICWKIYQKVTGR